MSLLLTSLIGFGAEPPSASVIGTVRSVSLTSNSGGWNGYTARVIFALAGLTVPSGTPSLVRVTLVAGSAEAVTISGLYIGHKAAAGDVYDFAAAPTQLTFDVGSASKVISAGATAVTDSVSFSWNKTSDLIIAMYFGGGSSSDETKNGTASNCSYWYKLANDPSTVDATGYTEVAGSCLGVSLIETNGF